MFATRSLIGIVPKKCYFLLTCKCFLIFKDTKKKKIVNLGQYQIRITHINHPFLKKSYILDFFIELIKPCLDLLISDISWHQMCNKVSISMKYELDESYQQRSLYGIYTFIWFQLDWIVLSCVNLVHSSIHHFQNVWAISKIIITHTQSFHTNDRSPLN